MNQLFLLPKLETLEHIWVVDEILLQKLIDAMWDKPTIKQLQILISRGRLDAYSTGGGLILLETVDWVRGRELNLYGIVGSGILKQGAAIMRDLKLIAQHKGCSMIGGTGVPKGWLRYATRIGFEIVSTHFVMEI